MKKFKYIILGMFAFASVVVLLGCGKKASGQSGNNKESGKINELKTNVSQGVKELATDAVDGIKEIASDAAESASEMMSNLSETVKSK